VPATPEEDDEWWNEVYPSIQRAFGLKYDVAMRPHGVLLPRGEGFLVRMNGRITPVERDREENVSERLGGGVWVSTEDLGGPRAALARSGPQPPLAAPNESYQNLSHFNQPGAERER
jgi:hypothetical protein